ncbi:glycosyltransferase family 4 protein [Haloarcula marismortui]|uniref:glycosyltransferase family 4 protein n=1 Tax=Haloarcula marismortui TaxID=2238 RepID=UPI000322CEA5|nr:glycosyltransferase family 4 protein [Haloarcula californiae]
MADKIALLTPYDISTAQGSTEIYYISQGLSERYKLDIFSPHDPMLPSANFRKIPFIQFIPDLLLFNIIALPVMLYYCLVCDYDVIYSYKGFIFSPLFMALTCEAKWITDFRTKPTEQEKEFNQGSIFVIAYYKLQDILYKFCLTHSDCVISISTPVADHIREKYSVDGSKMKVIQSGVDTSKFLKRENCGSEDPIKLVYVGTVSPQRDFETVIEAMSSPNLTRNIEFHIVGDGPDEHLKKLKQQISSEGVDNSVVWHGYVKHDNIPNLLTEMHIAVSPLPPLDSFIVSSPVKLFEYLATGLPVICTNIRPHQVLLKQNSAGLFYQAYDSHSLVNQLNSIPTNDKEWEEMIDQARRIAEKNSWSNRVSTVIRIIES